MTRDNNALEELNGMTLEVRGSGFAAFYSDTLDMGLVLAFSNPNAGSNKIGGKFLAGMPTEWVGRHGRTWTITMTGRRRRANIVAGGSW